MLNAISTEVCNAFTVEYHYYMVVIIQAIGSPCAAMWRSNYE